MSETQHNNADLDCFKTLMLQETLKIQNQHEVSCAFSEVTNFCKQVGCATNRFQFHTARQKLKLFLSTQVYAWTEFLVIEVFHSAPKRTDGPKREPWGNQSAVVRPNMHNPIPIKHTNVIPTNIDHIPSNTTHSGSSAMLYVFEDNEAVIKMIIKGRNPTMRQACFTDPQGCSGLVDCQD